MHLTVIDSSGAVVAHVQTESQFDEPNGIEFFAHIVGTFDPGPAYPHLEALLREFRKLYASASDTCLPFHESLDRLGLIATDEFGNQFDVSNIYFQQGGLLFAATPRPLAQPVRTDVELYVRTRDCSRVMEWLERSLGPLLPTDTAGDITIWQTRVGPIVVTAGVRSGQLVSVFINSPAAPWGSDADFARALVAALNIEVYCDPGPLLSTRCPDEFLEIDSNGERVVVWTPT